MIKFFFKIMKEVWEKKHMEYLENQSKLHKQYDMRIINIIGEYLP